MEMCASLRVRDGAVHPRAPRAEGARPTPAVPRKDVKFVKRARSGTVGHHASRSPRARGLQDRVREVPGLRETLLRTQRNLRWESR